MSKYDSKAVRQEAFSKIDDYSNQFNLIRGITSSLLYGDPQIDSKPWLSLLIPTFNRAKLFREALESALAQEPVEYRWEILVVDNTPLQEGRTSPALKVVQDIGNLRVLYYHNSQNIGPGYNWNRGVELARGEWICFLHDDDILCPDALKNIGRQINGFRGKRPLGYLHARRIEFTQILQIPSSKSFPPERLTRFSFLISGCTGAGAPSCGTVILKQAFMETGGINYEFGLSADAVMCYQIMKDHAVICSDRILGGYRWSENETLQLSSLLQMIQTDELLSMFSYQQSRFSRCWGQVFGAASSWRNIQRKKHLAEKNGIVAQKEDFQKATLYSEPKKWKQICFLAIYSLYRLFRFLDGWAFQLYQYVLNKYSKYDM